MKKRVVIAGIGLVVLGLVAAWRWDLDHRGTAEPRNRAPSVNARVAEQTPAIVAESTHREVIEPTPAPEPGSPVPPAFIGRVETLDGQPIDGVRVERVEYDEKRDHDVVKDATATRADGSFSMPAARGSSATLQFVAARHVDATRDAVLPGEFITVKLEPGIEARGRVLDRDTRAPIVGASVARAFVNFLKPGFTRTDEQGRFAIVVRRLPAVLTAWTEGYRIGRAIATGVDQSVEIELPSQAISDADVWYRVVDRETKAPIDAVTIEPGPAERAEAGVFRAGIRTYGGDSGALFDAEGYVREWKFADPRSGADREHPIEVDLAPASSIAGTVRTREGTAVEGARISVRSVATAQHKYDWPSEFLAQPAQSDVRGRFVVAEVPIGRPFMLVVEVDGVVRLESEPFEAPTHARIEGGDFIIEDANALEVSVTDGAGGPPVPGATLRAFRTERVDVAVTDAQGVATIVPANGVRYVTASARGHAPAWAPVDPRNDAGRVTLALNAPARIAGTVSESGGVPLDGASVEIRLVAGEPIHDALLDFMSEVSCDPAFRRTLTDAAGAFVFDDLAPGDYAVFATHPDAGTEAAGAPRYVETIAHTGRSDVALILQSTATLVVRVTSARTGAVCDPIFATVSAATQPYPLTRGLRYTGGLESKVVAANVALTVEVGAPGHASKSVEVPALAPRELRTIEIALEPASNWSGHVRFEDATPAAFANVHLAPTAQPRDGTNLRADAEGAFVFDRLLASEYGVDVSASRRPTDDEHVPMLVEPPTITFGVGESRTQDLRLRHADGGPLAITLKAEGMPADAEIVTVSVSLYPTVGNRWADRTNARDGDVWQLAGLPVGTYSCAGQFFVKTTAGGQTGAAAWNRCVAVCEPATLEVTRGSMAVTLTLRMK